MVDKNIDINEKYTYSRNSFLKKRLITTYFNFFSNSDVSSIQFDILIKDKSYFKFFLFPKRFYRKYYLRLKSSTDIQIIKLDRKNKDLVMRYLILINSST
jgi:hypothetical protein